jgi:ABC-type branched-subunit amino acid transport system substrate-binding protein
VERIGVFYQNDPYGQAGLAGVTKALAARQRKPFATGTVERNSVDVDAAVGKLADAQAIVQIGLYQPCAAFIRKIRKAGYAGPFYNLSPVGTTTLMNELGKDSAGVMVTQIVPSPYSRAKPIAREFAEAIEAGGNKVQANYTSMEGFVAAKLFTEGLRRIGGKPTREGLIAALESLNDDLGGFRVKLGPGNHAASSFVELSLLGNDGRVMV